MDTAAWRPCRTLVVMRHDAVAGLDDAGCVERAARLESGNANHFSGLDRGSALDPLDIDIDIDSLDHRSGTRVNMGDEGEPARGYHGLRFRSYGRRVREGARLDSCISASRLEEASER